MSHTPKCRHCRTEYEAYSEQQAGFAYDVTIKVWVCPACGHRKAVISQEDIDEWDVAKRYIPPSKKRRDFESIYNNRNKSRGVPGILSRSKDHNCGDGKDGGSNGGCGGGCGSCGH